MIRLSDMASLYHADCREALRGLASDSVDSICTDPPYELNFMGKGWDDTGIANDPALWAEVFRVLKPGGHLAAFSASRTYHRMACAIEDAGFEIRDSLMWIYGTGFPKSQDVSKFIDKDNGKHLVDLTPFGAYVKQLRTEKGCSLGQLDEMMSTNTAASWWEGRKSGVQLPSKTTYEKLKSVLGMDSRFDALIDWAEAEREKIGEKKSGIANKAEGARHTIGASESVVVDITAPATDAARQWEGFGTALKPAFEPIVLARKPLSEGTVAANVLKWGTGALNIGACRVEGSKRHPGNYVDKRSDAEVYGKYADSDRSNFDATQGRWPANVVTDGSDEVVGMFPNTAGSKAHKRNSGNRQAEGWGMGGDDAERHGVDDPGGSAARFFYSAKASKADRNGSKHPTVKPIALMEWLATLVTPPGGTILDPFAGSGTTGIAATRKGFRVILCEREAEYVQDIKNRFGVDIQRVPVIAAPPLAPPPY